ncbi:lamin tail domain-containing protein [Candidatus Woesearchaeota archaeon]|nr:lamin tail domain-containing protein [Candidatus Woesearchaeota archaeon]
MYLRVLLGILLFLSPAAAIEISEVMYNPEGSDTNHEWVEIYTNETAVNLSGWKFFEANTPHGLTLVSGSWLLPNNSFAVIVQNDAIFLLDYPNFSGTLFDSSFDLRNTYPGELIALKNSTHFITNLTYNISLGADDGLSLQLINGSWYAASPTPGVANAVTSPSSPPGTNTSNISGKDLSLSVALDPIVHLFVNYTSLFKITNLDHQTGIDDSINATVFYNVSRNNTLIFTSTFEVVDLNSFKTARTGSILLNETGNYTLCGEILNTTVSNYNRSNDFACGSIQALDTSSVPCNVSLNILVSSTVANNSETMHFSPTITNESFPYTIEYWIEDLFGRVAKSKVNTSNTNQKSWTPQITESDRVFFIKGRIVSLFCNDTSLGDNTASQLLVVQGAQKENSTLVIDTIYTGSDNRVKYGEILRVRSQIYKGDESKNAVEAWVEQQGKRISRITSAALYTDFSAYDLTFAIPLEPNCNAEFPDGTAEVVISGFGITERAPVSVSGVSTSTCKTTVRSASSGGSSLLPQKSLAIPLIELLSFSGTADAGIPFSTTLRITNSDAEQHTYSAWSYVYRGPKSYSGARDMNVQKITLAPGSSAVVQLTNRVEEAGDFSFKAQVRKDEQKTTHDLTRPITVMQRASSYLEEVVVVQQAAPSRQAPLLPATSLPETIYLSPASRSQELAGLLIIGMLTSITLFIIWKKL